jgi:simple sugar transport system permease protein
MIRSNEKATRYSGVDTKWVLLGVYVLSSLLAVVAALVMMARFNSANASYGESYISQDCPTPSSHRVAYPKSTP